jgi:hypothetical protein
MQVAALKGSLLNQSESPNPRHPARRVSLSFFVQRRRDTEARQGVRASGLHEKLLF